MELTRLVCSTLSVKLQRIVQKREEVAVRKSKIFRTASRSCLPGTNCCSLVLLSRAVGEAPARPSRNPRKHEDRDLPGGLLLILGKNRHLSGLAVVQPLVLITSCYFRSDPKTLAPQLDCPLRVSD